ncbi:hypothetical protein ROJ8625_02207 [Roseivivax jejudonensis]|uniref:DinB family protein n=1 Tax=Roseivivax jejudonensis TaxID=1529041 RepID=A0A1X6ZA21_9RHOB|nr:hypothetical protein [Roseivivax jejudonensis]SLN45844.1 hypothetical protein ROJ8625_02207 [Roseivivax jejudonensis]
MPVFHSAPILLIVLSTPVLAQHDHAMGQGHAADAETTLSEPGQGAFAALTEVVALLEVDPATDWSSVDLSALREHLVDMDLLATRAEVQVTRLPNGLQAVARGDAATAAALGRMVPAHAKQLSADTSWTAQGEATEDGAILTVTSDDAATVERIHALGFFGLMASQDHHRAHHLAIATGGSPHAH